MRRANIYVKNQLAGLLTETDEGYRFQYDSTYLQLPQATPVSLTMPLQESPYESRDLFPFFDGLIPEGWLLRVAIQTADVSLLDRMGLLLLCCKDCIGDVSVVPIQE